MSFVLARILTKDGVVVAEDVPVWMTFFRLGNGPRWDGSFEVPATTLFSEPTYQLQLHDGRQGTITQINAWMKDENITVYFAGQGPLRQAVPQPRCQSSRVPALDHAPGLRSSCE